MRHPDVTAWLESHGATGNWLTELDDYYNKHLPPRMGQWVGAAQDHASLRQIVALIQGVVQPVSGATRSLADWAPPIAQLLLTFYGDRVLAPEDPDQYYTLKSLEQLREVLCEFQQIPDQIAPTVSASQAIEQLLKQVESQQIPSAHAPQSD